MVLIKLPYNINIRKNEQKQKKTPVLPAVAQSRFLWLCCIQQFICTQFRNHTTMFLLTSLKEHICLPSKVHC